MKMGNDPLHVESGERDSSDLPLSGVRVLDLSRMIAGPLCGQVLADLGAEVIKVERPNGGDEMRSYGPMVRDRAGEPVTSSYFLAVNRNKKSVTVDLAKPDGAAIVRALAERSDVLVENYKVGDLRRYGLDYDSLKSHAPHLIYCSITGFGQTGPDAHRPGLDTVFQAMSGLMSITGDPDGPPQKVGAPICDFVAGLYATIAIQAALRQRAINGGEGQQLDIALLDCTISALTSRAQVYLTSGEIPERTGVAAPGMQPAGVYRCADGEIVLSAGADHQFERLANTLGQSSWVRDSRYSTLSQRLRHQRELNATIEAVLSRDSRAAWLELLQSVGIMCAPINTVAEALADPQVTHRNVVVTAEDPRIGSVPMIASPIRMSGTAAGPVSMPPGLGEHTTEVLTGLLGIDANRIEKLRIGGVI